jgi:phospholipase/carboxylesterase
VFPHAPRRGVTINGGLIMPAWYDILRFSDAAGSERADHVRESAEMVEGLLARERERGVPSTKTLLAGFSQGAALALYTGIRHAHPLGGIIVLSGYEVLSTERPAESANAATRMLFAHGTYDPVVPVSRGRTALKAYEAGREAVWHEYPMGHEVCAEEVADIRDWLHTALE